MAHLVFKFIAAGLIRWIVEWRTGEPRIMLGWKEYCKRVALTGMCRPGEGGGGGARWRVGGGGVPGCRGD